MPQEKILSEQEFVKLFLTLLCRNGIFKINEDELSKKLYCYTKKKEYEELFQNITSSIDYINIKDGINHEKYFAQNICFLEQQPEKLFLLYDAGTKTKSLKEEFKISDRTLLLMNQIAIEFAIAKRIEHHGKTLMNIFNKNPNQDYTLTSGKYHSKTLTWDLITDGVVKEIKPINLELYENCFWKEPGSKTKTLVKLNKFQGKCVTIESASYVVLQGKVDKKLKELEIRTEQMDINYLKRVSEIAHQVYHEENNLSENPTVKRMILK